MALEGADGRVRFRVLGLAFDYHAVVFHVDAHVGVPETPGNGAFWAVDGHVEMVDLDGYVVGDFQFDSHG